MTRLDRCKEGLGGLEGLEGSGGLGSLGGLEGLGGLDVVVLGVPTRRADWGWF